MWKAIYNNCHWNVSAYLCILSMKYRNKKIFFLKKREKEYKGVMEYPIISLYTDGTAWV